GRKNNQLLIQPQYYPMSVGEQVAILYCGTNALMADIEIDKVKDFEDHFIHIMKDLHADVIAELESGKVTAEAEGTIKEVAATVCKMLNNS
ncbi:MAG: F0F1 ATP synthase subunit alpha, partial [Bacteroidales bacterium]|nr:F0F1 ATP synthase subunit alpha [Bacteroidales bacterium]